MPDAAHLAGWVGLDSGQAGAKSRPEKVEGRAFWVPGVLSLPWSQAKAQANAHHLCSRPWSLPHPDAHSPLTCGDPGDARVQRARHWPGQWSGNRGVGTGTTSLRTAARCLPQSPRALCPVQCPPVTFMPRRACQAQGGPCGQGRVAGTSIRVKTSSSQNKTLCISPSQRKGPRPPTATHLLSPHPPGPGSRALPLSEPHSSLHRCCKLPSCAGLQGFPGIWSWVPSSWAEGAGGIEGRVLVTPPSVVG